MSLNRESIWLLLALACAGVIVCYPMHDVYWHLANGREMLAQGRIVNEEVLSWTRAGVPFANHERLTQILWCLVYREWGGGGSMLSKSRSRWVRPR